MCSLGRHQLADDLPAPKIRARQARPRKSRKDLPAARAGTTHLLEVETGRLDPEQARAQDQFAMQFEPLPPGLEHVGDDQPRENLPYWVTMP